MKNAARLVLIGSLLLGAPRPGLCGLGPESVDAWLGVGHDSNLLDASDADLSAFARHDPGAFFVVPSMEDEFLQGAVSARWRPGRLPAGRPALGLSAERRQYLHAPIRSEESYGLDVRVPVALRTRLRAGLGFQPQVYVRHRHDDEALPGEPEFRPEVYRRWDLELGVTQIVGGGAELLLGAEGSIRDYRAPFDGRDRRMAGASAGLIRPVGQRLRIGLVGAYRRNWSRNTPGDPTDLSSFDWTVHPTVEARSFGFLSAFRIGLELGWRHFTSSDPADQGHYGRTDRQGELDVELTRSLSGSLASVTRFTRTWRTSNQPGGDADEGSFSDNEVQTGLAWGWEHSRKKGR